jgi:hypothetical protein
MRLPLLRVVRRARLRGRVIRLDDAVDMFASAGGLRVEDQACHCSQKESCSQPTELRAESSPDTAEVGAYFFYSIVCKHALIFSHIVFFGTRHVAPFK